ncbi:MAG: hypothetical protein WCB55_17520, partial [Pseudolabrys sp.]
MRLDSDGLGTATQLSAPDVKHMISEVKLHSQVLQNQRASGDNQEYLKDKSSTCSSFARRIGIFGYAVANSPKEPDMSPTSAAAQVVPAPTLPDLSAVKTRQQGAWSSGDYATVGTTLQIVGETLCEALDLRAGQKVLDVAAGNGNVTLAAARRWCEVVSTDYVPALLE